VVTKAVQAMTGVLEQLNPFAKGAQKKQVKAQELESLAKVEEGKAQINRDTAFLFLLQTVGVNIGEGFDETGLAVVNVASGA
jgi:hypothetical protein